MFFLLCGAEFWPKQYKICCCPAKAPMEALLFFKVCLDMPRSHPYAPSSPLYPTPLHPIPSSPNNSSFCSGLVYIGCRLSNSTWVPRKFLLGSFRSVVGWKCPYRSWYWVSCGKLNSTCVLDVAVHWPKGAEISRRTHIWSDPLRTQRGAIAQ